MNCLGYKMTSCTQYSFLNSSLNKKELLEIKKLINQ